MRTPVAAAARVPEGPCGGSKGQGDGYNEGFLRPEAILAVMHVSDEEDCSIKDAGKAMFAQGQEATAEYGALNLRCGIYADNDEYIWPAKRYIDGPTSLKRDYPDRIIFGAIVGIRSTRKASLSRRAWPCPTWSSGRRSRPATCRTAAGYRPRAAP